MKNYITIYADECDRDLWKDYCDACGLSYDVTSITIHFTDEDVEYTE